LRADVSHASLTPQSIFYARAFPLPVHPSESRGPESQNATDGLCASIAQSPALFDLWVPAFAGMNGGEVLRWRSGGRAERQDVFVRMKRAQRGKTRCRIGGVPAGDDGVGLRWVGLFARKSAPALVLASAEHSLEARRQRPPTQKSYAETLPISQSSSATELDSASTLDARPHFRHRLTR